ncbi:glutaredoxin 3 [Methylobacterium nodulans]|uniref:Glutaredoxin n=1 Tax=Methylobacterium nodulans (strain LMG 21967 / CNCM I-2342 / ORS 2060) TaxID=460265 RepID=B8ISY1_METNO|nr:glutaredoxin 3 [Methylobacterium nodulans]ACL60780.1 glutaredoxin 3 [Methylobacterium nodulans ORS 2060]
MQPVTIYTTSWCPYCTAAKSLLREKGAAFTEIDIEVKAGARREMIGKAGGRTSVPQIFIGSTHVGGCDDLYALDRAGRLDPLLAG